MARDGTFAKHIERFILFKVKWILAGTMMLIFTVFYVGILRSKHKCLYEVVERNIEEIRDNLYGPYDFLSDSEVAVSITYEVTYSDENFLSICYNGTYADRLAYAGNVGYAITIDLKNETIVKLEDIIGGEGKDEVLVKIKNGEFTTENGAVTPDNKYINIDSIMQDQPIIDADSSRYYYFLRDDRIGIIIVGLPRYGGNYAVICVRYLWM